MNTIVLTILAALLFLVLPGVLLARRARRENRTMPMSTGIAIFTTTVALIVVAFGWAVYDGQLRDWRECRRSVDDSQGDRLWDEFLIVELTAVKNEVRDELGVVLDSLEEFPQRATERLAEFNPERVYSECVHP